MVGLKENESNKFLIKWTIIIIIIGRWERRGGWRRRRRRRRRRGRREAASRRSSSLRRWGRRRRRRRWRWVAATTPCSWVARSSRWTRRRWRRSRRWWLSSRCLDAGRRSAAGPVRVSLVWRRHCHCAARGGPRGPRDPRDPRTSCCCCAARSSNCSPPAPPDPNPKVAIQFQVIPSQLFSRSVIHCSSFHLVSNSTARRHPNSDRTWYAVLFLAARWPTTSRKSFIRYLVSTFHR